MTKTRKRKRCSKCMRLRDEKYFGVLGKPSKAVSEVSVGDDKYYVHVSLRFESRSVTRKTLCNCCIKNLQEQMVEVMTC